ncbi:hypothetical protein yberc0001_18960 [Yersinia bercovieri ATCC 43970]|uniref:Uncharacterized protein n=1 Tax=Yersinia bercovieri ATCC 43970 TaxID=349968 RepID=A0ABM9XV24_YERBE|nr:hypothetical protein yberc0001_18960 [Yersinia bercovieri ATCC 43970]
MKARLFRSTTDSQCLDYQHSIKSIICYVAGFNTQCGCPFLVRLRLIEINS